MKGGIGGLVGGIFMRGNKSNFLRHSALRSRVCVCVCVCVCVQPQVLHTRFRAEVMITFEFQSSSIFHKAWMMQHSVVLFNPHLQCNLSVILKHSDAIIRLITDSLDHGQ